MEIKLRFFGQLKEITKVDVEAIQVKEETTLDDLVWIVGQRFPNLQEHLKTVSFAIDKEYAPKETLLKEGNEVSLLPPISGG